MAIRGHDAGENPAFPTIKNGFSNQNKLFEKQLKRPF
jgi:hypothetical protein